MLVMKQLRQLCVIRQRNCLSSAYITNRERGRPTTLTTYETKVGSLQRDFLTMCHSTTLHFNAETSNLRRRASYKRNV